VVAPPAVSVVELPAQMAGAAGVTDMVALGLIDTLTVAVLVHPAVVPVTV